MSERERILTIRLMEKVNANPAYEKRSALSPKTAWLNLSDRPLQVLLIISCK